MSQIIKLSISKIKGVAPVSAVSYGFDIDDIVIPITFNSATGKSTIEARQIKGGQPDGRSVAKVEYEVNHTLSGIAAMSDKFFVGTVIGKRGIVATGQRVFNSKRISENLVPTVSGTKFFYCEDGDPNGVEYEVSETIDQIITQLQTTAVASINVRNGLSISGGFVEWGGLLIQDTTIDMNQWFVDFASTVLGYTTSFKKTYNTIDDSINDGAGNTYVSNTSVSAFTDYKTLASGVSYYSFGKPGGRSYTEWVYNKTTDSQYSYVVHGEAVGIPDILGNPTFGMFWHVQSSLAGPGAFDMGFYLDEYNGFSVADTRLGSIYKHFNVTQEGYSKFQDGSLSDNDEVSAILNLESVERGFLCPRMTTVQKNAISSPADGLIVFDVTLNRHEVFKSAVWGAL